MYKLYRNLNATGPDEWSIQLNSQPVNRATCIYAENVTIKQPSGKKFNKCLAGGNRAVFAWFKSDNAITNNIIIIISAILFSITFVILINLVVV